MAFILRKEGVYRDMVIEELGLLIESKVRDDMDDFLEQVTEVIDKTEKIVQNKKKKRKKWISN